MNSLSTEENENRKEKERRLRLRRKVLNEIISSEESYIEQLDMLLNVTEKTYLLQFLCSYSPVFVLDVR